MDVPLHGEGVDDVGFMPACDDAGHVDEVDVGLRALEALNVRVKHFRGAEMVLDLIEGLPDGDRFPQLKDAALSAVAETERIYALKDAFLDALVAAGRATAARFRVEPPAEEAQDWYLVTAKDYSFHVPGDVAGPAVRAAAVEVEPHDPYQEAREVPETGLTLEEELAALERAVECLRARGASS